MNSRKIHSTNENQLPVSSLGYIYVYKITRMKRKRIKSNIDEEFSSVFNLPYNSSIGLVNFYLLDSYFKGLEFLLGW